jgi:hypothetical protein
VVLIDGCLSVELMARRLAARLARRVARRRLERVRRSAQIAEGGAGAEEAGTHGVDGEMEEVGDFGVAELLEFAEEEDFAVDGVELFDGAADPEAGFGGVLFGGIGNGAWMAEKHSAEGGFAAVGPKNFEDDGVEVGAEEGARFVAIGGAEQD